MFLLILESFSTTELFFVLLMALVFFGPRKLPQLSRTLGKNIAEFRKASEDFKRTWEREVAFEESQVDSSRSALQQPDDNSILNLENQSQQFPEPLIEPVPAADAVGRHTMSDTVDPALSAGTDETNDDQIKSEPLRKQDWL